MSYLRAISLSSFLLLASTLVNSQQLAEVFDNPSEHIIRRVDEVVLMISATDRRGRFISNMRREDFEILDNHHPPSKWNYFQSHTDLPLRVMLVVDTSTSVGERLRLEQKAACAFLKRVLRPNVDEVGLIAFESEVHKVQPLTKDVSTIAAAIKNLHVGDETKLYDALVTGSQELNQISEVQPLRRVILLVTDGVDTKSQVSLERAEEELLKSEAVVLAFDANYPSDQVPKGAKVLQDLALSTGGFVLPSQDTSDFISALRKAELFLRNQYAVGYTPMALKADGSFRPIEVKAIRQGLRLHSRNGYYAPKRDAQE